MARAEKTALLQHMDTLKNMWTSGIEIKSTYIHVHVIYINTGFLATPCWVNIVKLNWTSSLSPLYLCLSLCLSVYLSLSLFVSLSLPFSLFDALFDARNKLECISGIDSKYFDNWSKQVNGVCLLTPWSLLIEHLNCIILLYELI